MSATFRNSSRWTRLRSWARQINYLRVRAEIIDILSVEAPVGQGAKVQAYHDMSSYRNAARRDAAVHENVKLFLREPFGLAIRGQPFYTKCF